MGHFVMRSIRLVAQVIKRLVSPLARMKIAVAAGVAACRQNATKQALRSDVTVRFETMVKKSENFPENPEYWKMIENVIFLQK